MSSYKRPSTCHPQLFRPRVSVESPPKQRIVSFGKQRVIRWGITPLQGCRVMYVMTIGSRGDVGPESAGHNLGISDLNQRLSWAPLASLGEH